MVDRKKTCIRMLVAMIFSLMLCVVTFGTAAYASEVKVVVEGDIPELIAQFAAIIKEPLQVALSYLTSFLTYLANWLGQF